ncbi:MAG: hypothetical protein ACLPV8_02025 [Steroidobacteraceae bacterium]
MDNLNSDVEHRIAIVPAALPVAVEQFALDLATHGNATAAYRRTHPTAGKSANAVEALASLLRRRPDVAARVDELRAAAAKVILDLAPQMYQHLHEIAYEADPGELSGVRWVNCRRCWGLGGMPTWIDEREFNDAIAQAAAKNSALPGSCVPPTFGGFYDVLGEPNEVCRHCGGQGIERPFTCDTTKLEGPSRKLFVKARPDGTLELEDRQKARAELHRLLGLIIDRKDSRSVVVHVEPLRDLTPAEVIELMSQQKALTR